MKWKHIQFADGSNPYICKTDKEFNRIKRKYRLELIEDNFYRAYERQIVRQMKFCIAMITIGGARIDIDFQKGGDSYGSNS